MTRWIRFGLALLRAPLRGRLRALDEELVLSLRAWPTDSDFNVVNHAALVSFMELGRIDLMARSGFLSLALRNGWTPLVSAIDVRFERSAKPLQPLTLTTRLVYADDSWLYVRHRLASRGKTVASAVVQATVRRGRQRVSHLAVLEALGLPYRWEETPPALARGAEPSPKG